MQRVIRLEVNIQLIYYLPDATEKQEPFLFQFLIFNQRLTTLNKSKVQTSMSQFNNEPIQLRQSEGD